MRKRDVPIDMSGDVGGWRAPPMEFLTDRLPGVIETFLAHFDDLFKNEIERRRMRQYVSGLLMSGSNKTMTEMALPAPFRSMGRNAWLVGAIKKCFRDKQDRALRDSRRRGTAESA